MNCETTEIIQSVKKDCEEYLDQTLDHLPNLHSEFQIDNFVLAKDAYTGFGMYKKAQRELSRRVSVLQDLFINLEMAQAELEVLQEELEDGGLTPAREKLKQVEIKKADLKVSRIKSNIKDVHKEYKAVLRSYKPLHLEFKDADLEEEELKYWFEHYKVKVLRALRYKGLMEAEAVMDGLDDVFRERLIIEVRSFLSRTLPEEQFVKAKKLLESRNA